MRVESEERRVELEMRGNVSIAYLCTGKVPNCKKTGCAYSSESLFKDCGHTLNPDYARNGATHDPAKDDRFVEVCPGRWWELEEDEAREAQTHAETPEAVE